jgi:hypothetical protein
MSGTAAADAPQERWPENGGAVTSAEVIHRRRWWTLAALTLPVFMVGIDTTVLNVALPSLVRELGASASQLQWITTAYSLVFAGLLLTAGSLGDRFGRKGALTLGLVIFGLGSALCAFAPSTMVLIAARGVLGLLEHPGVASAGVIGIHDLVHGENVRAYITLTEGTAHPASQELIQFARARVGYKAPEEIVVLDNMPLTATGKLDRTHLKQMAEANLARGANR